MKIDYPELEGKVIDYVNPKDKPTKVKVIGCSYHVGITLMRVEDFKEYKSGDIACCLIRKKACESNTKAGYRKRFFKMVAAIKSGGFSPITITRERGATPQQLQEMCPFR